MARSEFEEQYDAVMAGEEREIRGAILTEPVSRLEPARPILIAGDAMVRDAIGKMKEAGQGAVCVVDAAGRLLGIFSERDVVMRVAAQDRDPRLTRVSDVMTAKPETLRPESKIAFALNRMSIGGFRNLPIVDEAGKPVGIVFTRHFVKFIVSLFPEATLNLSPHEELKNPGQMHGG